MVPNEQPSVPWEVKMNYSTMGWFHFGKTGRFTNKRWSKKYLMIWCIFWPFSGSEGPPKGPWGSPMVPNGKLSELWEVRWIILLWDYFTMGDLGVSWMKGDQRNIWFDAYFCHFQALKLPPRAPEGPQWFPMNNLVCREKSRWIILLRDYFTMGELGVSLTKGDQRNIWWFDAYFGHFQALKGPLRAPEGPWGFSMVSNGQPSVPWVVEMNYSTKGLFQYGRTGCFTNER